MGVAEISLGPVMGGGAPVYGPARKSETVTTSTTSATATITADDGDYLRVAAINTDIYVAIGGSTSTRPRRCILAGTAIDIGPLKAGDTINVADRA